MARQGHKRAEAYLQWSLGKRRGTPWTGGHSITGQLTDTQDNQPCTLTPKEDIEKPVNLTVMFLHCGGKPEYPERTWQLHRKDHKSEFEHRTLLLQGNSATKQLILQPDDGIVNHFIITITLGLVGIVVTNIIIFKSVFYLLHYQHSCWPLCISLPF
ncbi:hypothetical protein ILYODFUR_029835 [Ilyodon furcidens]|uniref:Uncharacterized protein n=1 Tax=Ilyodon furcidens TaxID=33524 RepID=A0ABV0UL87_9TELE